MVQVLLKHSVLGNQGQSEEAEWTQDSSEEPQADYQDTFNILEEDRSFEYQLPIHQPHYN